MKTDYEFIVLGAGGAGAAIAYELSKRGSGVLLLEQFSIGHDRGSSHGHSRIFRYAYDELDYVKLAMKARSRWESLSNEAGIPLLQLTGGLDLGPSSTPSLRATAENLKIAGAEFEELDFLALNKRFPQWKVPNDWSAIYSPDGGIINPSQTVEVLAALARSHGATILEWTQAIGIETALKEPMIETSKGFFSCKRLIIAAGAWLPKLIDIAKPVTVSLESTVFFKPNETKPFEIGQFPVFIEHNSMAYGFPIYGLPGIKLGFHHAGMPTTAGSRIFDVPEEILNKMRGFLDQYLPKASGTIIQGKTCLYTNTPTRDFWIEQHPESPNILIVSPCSGHGFKFAPLIGEILADLATGKENEHYLPRFLSARWQSTIN